MFGMKRPTERRVAIRRALVTIVAIPALIWTLLNAGPALVITRPLDNPDAIVMLASHEWERLPAAAAIARRYTEAVVVLTVPQTPSYWNCFRCADRVDWLSREGVDRRRIVELGGTSNTYGEARAVRAHLEAHDLKRLVVVTSPYHARRSLMTFRSVLAGTGIQVGIAPATDTSNATPRAWWRHDLDRAYVAYEWAAIAMYAGRYGVSPFEPCPADRTVARDGDDQPQKAVFIRRACR